MILAIALTSWFFQTQDKSHEVDGGLPKKPDVAESQGAEHPDTTQPVVDGAGEALADAQAGGKADIAVPQGVDDPASYVATLDEVTAANWETFRRRYPGLDPTDDHEFHQAVLMERAQYPASLSQQDRDAYSSWLAEMEPLRAAMIENRGRIAGLELAGTTPDGRGFGLTGFNGAEPVFMFTENSYSAISTAASYVRRNAEFDAIFGPEVDGSGFFVNVNDGGFFHLHPEFRNDDDTEWRVTQIRGNRIHNHATHVAGTLGARGIDERSMGMAPAVHLYSFQWDENNDVINYGMDWPGRPGRAIVGNASYGSNNAETNGVYRASSAVFDSLLLDTPYYLHFFSAGNGGPNYFTLTSGRKDGKNCFAVAKLNRVVRDDMGVRTEGGLIRVASSRGPTRDGRIKPDISVNGTDIRSTSGEDSYRQSTASSFASPTAAGSAVLLQDYFSKRFNGNLMRASTLMALIINTAEDLGAAGPDYTYGWGLMNTLEAGRVIQRHAENPHTRQICEEILPKGGIHAFSYQRVGDAPVRATLVWTDPPGPARVNNGETAPVLMNNLNLRLIAPDGTEHFPFVMPYVTGTGDGGLAPFDENLLGEPATTGENFTDNKIQVLVDEPEQGVWTVEVYYHGELVGDSQQYSLVLGGLESTMAAAPPQIAAHSTWGVAGDNFALVEITGDGFILGAEVSFRRWLNDEMVVRAAHAVEVTGGRIQARVDLTEMEEGEWTLVVRNPDGLETEGPQPYEQPFEVFDSTRWVGAMGKSWHTAGNWNPAVVPLAVGDVTFDDTAQSFAVTVDALVNPGNLFFNHSSHDYAVTAGAGNGFGGDAGLIKNGTGELSLGGIGSTFTGDVQVNAGTLRLTNWEALGATGKTIAIADGAMVNLNGNQSSQAGRHYSWSIAGDGVDGGGAITNSGAGVSNNAGIENLTLTGNASIGGTGRFDIGRSGNDFGSIDGGGFTLTKNGGNEVVLRGSATNIFYRINSGILVFQDDNAAAGNNTITVNGGTLGSWGNRSFANNIHFTAAGAALQSGGGVGTWNGNLSLNGDVIFRANNGLVINGDVTGVGNITKAGSNVLTVGTGGLTGDIGDRNVAITAGRFDINREGAINLGGDLTGDGMFWTRGSGTTTLSGDNRWQGNTRVLGGGTLEVVTVDDAGGPGALGAPITPGTGWLRVAANSTLRITGSGQQSTSRFVWNDGSDFDSGTGIFDVVDAEATVTFTATGGQINHPFVKQGAGSLTLSRQLTGAASVTVEGGILNLNGPNAYTGTTTIADDSILRFGLASNQTLNGAFSGGGVLIKSGAGSLTFGATNLHSGELWVEAGLLRLNNPSLDDLGVIRIASDATLDLPHGQADTVGQLWVDGIQQPTGTYDADNLPGRISGSGRLIVTSGPESNASPYESWATAFGLDGSPGRESGFDADPDGDGIANGLEWILGGDPLNGSNGALVTTTVPVGGSLTLSFTRNHDSLSVASLEVEYSATLDGSWGSVTIGETSTGPDANGVSVIIDTVPNPHQVMVTIPVTQTLDGRLFSRLKATRP